MSNFQLNLSLPDKLEIIKEEEKKEEVKPSAKPITAKPEHILFVEGDSEEIKQIKLFADKLCQKLDKLKTEAAHTSISTLTGYARAQIEQAVILMSEAYKRRDILKKEGKI